MMRTPGKGRGRCLHDGDRLLDRKISADVREVRLIPRLDRPQVGVATMQLAQEGIPFGQVGSHGPGDRQQYALAARAGRVDGLVDLSPAVDSNPGPVDRDARDLRSAGDRGSGLGDARWVIGETDQRWLGLFLGSLAAPGRRAWEGSAISAARKRTTRIGERVLVIT